jgi:amino acid adenylation domain-containing protein/non-ribosomal peptide synthase protein (TIGR01720 family)
LPASRKIEIEPGLFEKLKERAAHNRVPLETLLLGCWQAWTSRVIGVGQLMIGLLSHGRSASGLKDALGPLSKYIPLEASIDGSATLGDLVKRADESAREAESWADYFSWDLFESERDFLERQSNFFPVCCEFFQIPDPCAAAGVEFSTIRLSACTDRFKLKLSCIWSVDSIMADLVYDSSALHSSAVDAWAKQLKAILDGLSHDLSDRIDDIDMLGPDERKRVLIGLNDTAALFGGDAPAVRLIEDQVRLKPDGIAIESGAGDLSFNGLNCSANRLARYLLRQGVTPGDVVALYLERSPELVVSLLAVLKAGATYLPIDPALPQERVGFFLKDARSKLVLTQASLRPAIWFTGVRSFCPDAEWREFEHEAEEDLGLQVWPEDCAYIIYTSGSTGTPKGVMVTNRGLSNYLAWSAAAYRVEEGSGAPVHTPISFDLTVTSLLTPLAGGRRVKLLPEGDGIERLSQALISGEQYSLVKLTPAHLKLLSEILPSGGIKNCANVFVIGGEALFTDDLPFWRHSASKTRLVNEYGPTETVVGCCVYELPTDWNDEGSIPIGRPITNTRVYILNGALSLQPAGSVGELYIGGYGVATGYVGRPDMTAERFVPDPFSSEPGARMYRSGDLARLRLDSQIEYVGRNDHQVQIRGFRVELGEVEAALLAHPAVRAAAVITVEAANSTRLEAFVEMNQNRQVEPEQLIEFIKQKLPSYMVPTNALVLDQLPLTSNGKVDRQRLQALGRAAARERPYTAPRDDREAVLADIWAQVLGLERVGIHDNFFELGGDSVLTIQVVARANRVGFSYEPHHILARQTIAELAEVATNGSVGDSVEDQACGETPLTPIQEWFFEQDETDLNHYNQAVILAARDAVELAAFEAVVDALVERHAALRSAFFNAGPRWRLVITEQEENRVFGIVDLSQVSPEHASEVIERITNSVQASFDLDRGPLIRIVLFQFGDTSKQTGAWQSNLGDKENRCRARVLIIAHHLVIDSVSWAILLRDLEDGYLDFNENGRPEFGPVTSSYRRWALRLKYLAGEEWMQAQLQYWDAELRRSRARMVTDCAGENLEGGARIILTELNGEQTERLVRIAAAEYGAEVKELLVAALVRGAGDLFGDDGRGAFSIDLEGHGREDVGDRINLANSVGWFTCIYPVLFERRSEESLRSLIQRIKRQLRSVPAGGLGYGLLRYISKRDGRGNPLSAIHDSELSFNYLGFIGRELGRFFEASDESVGQTRSPKRRRRYLVEVNAEIRSGKLLIEWTYSDRLANSRVEAAARKTLQTIQVLIAQARRGESYDQTPSGAVNIRLRQRDIQTIMTSINRAGNRIKSKRK